MKKSIMLMLAMAFACSVQAASFTWTSNAVTYTGQGESGFWDVGFTGTLWLLDVTDGTTGPTVGPGGTLNLGSAVLVDTMTGNGSGYSAYENTIATATAGNSYQVVGYDSVGNLWGVSQVIVGTANPAIPGGGELNGGEFFNGSNPYDAGNAMILGTSVVPEPTSMALLALGVAALGLRRKFRK